MARLQAALTWKMGSHVGEAPWTLRLGLVWDELPKHLPSTASVENPSCTAQTATMNSLLRQCPGTPLWPVIYMEKT